LVHVSAVGPLFLRFPRFFKLVGKIPFFQAFQAINDALIFRIPVVVFYICQKK